MAYLEQLFRNVPVQDKSAREALQTFVGGKGDVMLAYENEAITAQQKEQPVDYVVPDQTILIENPIAVVSKSKNPDKAKAFVDFLRSAGSAGSSPSRAIGRSTSRSRRPPTSPSRRGCSPSRSWVAGPR